MTNLPETAVIRGTSESGEELFRCTWGSFAADNADGIDADELDAIARALASGTFYWLGGGAAGGTTLRCADVAQVLRKHLNIALAALDEIAAWDDEGANAYLAATGRYSAFDEPAAVHAARDALAKIRGGSNG
jgi:hypothetical protein